MTAFENKKVIVSGGGSGIGKALISELYHGGARDFAVIGRGLDKLEALKAAFPEASFLLSTGDLSKPDDIVRFATIVDQNWGMADLLINNAGVVSAGELGRISDDDIIAQVNINVTGLILLTKHTLPLLKKSKEAAIINVASGLAMIGMPFYATYAATKAAVSKFSEALRRELKNFPIHVMTTYPTATDTPMMQTAVVGKMDSPELVAQKTIEGLKGGAIDVVLGGDQRLEDVRLNFEAPTEFDKKAAAAYDAMKERTASHRSM